MLTAHLLMSIIELTPARSSISVASVRKPSASMRTLVNITEFILVRSLMNALNVENSSGIVQSFSDIRNFTVVNNPDLLMVIISVAKMKRDLVRSKGAGRGPRGEAGGALAMAS